MVLVPRKRCTKCGTVFEGVDVAKLYSCDVCGNGYLMDMKAVDPETQSADGVVMPRSGAPGLITHTRDNF